MDEPQSGDCISLMTQIQYLPHIPSSEQNTQVKPLENTSPKIPTHAPPYKTSAKRRVIQPNIGCAARRAAIDTLNQQDQSDSCR